MDEHDEEDWNLPWTLATDKAIDRFCWVVIIFALTYFSWHVLRAVL